LKKLPVGGLYECIWLYKASGNLVVQTVPAVLLFASLSISFSSYVSIWQHCTGLWAVGFAKTR